jgi:hypothetical protein
MRYITEADRQLFAEICDAVKLPIKDCVSKRRDSRTARRRMMVMYLLREMTDLTTLAIGRLVHRDHSTVMHGCKMIAKRPGPAELVKRALNSGWQIEPETMDAADLVKQTLRSEMRRQVEYKAMEAACGL